MSVKYQPEGILYTTQENRRYFSSLALMERAMAQKTILEARAILCDESFRLIFDTGEISCVMESDEVSVCPEGECVRDIAVISRVGKPVSFIVDRIDESGGSPVVYLSRRKAQMLCLEEYLDCLEDGDIINARITHLEPFGCFCDIGCGIISLLTIDRISVSRISHPRDRFRLGEYIVVAVKGRDEIKLGRRGRISLTHRELLGTWSENASRFNIGETVSGIIRGIESYGIFIELAPNLAGLAEYKDGVSIGETAAVYIKSIIPDKHKVKLVLVDTYYEESPKMKLEYFITSGNISGFDYFA